MPRDFSRRPSVTGKPLTLCARMSSFARLTVSVGPSVSGIGDDAVESAALDLRHFPPGASGGQCSVDDADAALLGEGDREYECSVTVSMGAEISGTFERDRSASGALKCRYSEGMTPGWAAEANHQT